MNKWRQFFAAYWQKFLLALIVMAGLIIRLHQVGELPAGLNRDEAALAYNAYLLSHTGMDEWRRVWPIFLESFGDQKLPGYPYLLVGLYRLGLDRYIKPDLLVRLPSVISGTVLIILAYALGQLFGGQKNGKIAGLISALLVSANPIFIWYSRGAWEANVGMCLWVAAVYLVAKAWRSQKSWTLWQLVTIFVLLVASFLTYNAPLLITSVLLIIVVWCGWQRGWQWWLPLLVTMSVSVILCWSILLPVTAQKGGITLFSDPTVHHFYLIYRENLPGWLRAFAGSKYVYLAGRLAGNTLSSLAPGFWWRGGTHPWHQLAGSGHLTLMTTVIIYVALLYFLGMVVRDMATSWRKKSWRSFLTSPYLVLAFVLFGALVPSVITTDSPHATRSLEFFYLLTVMSAVTVCHLFRKLKKQIKQKYILIAVGVIVGVQLAETGMYVYRYFTELPQTNIYHTGMEKVLSELDNNRPVLVRTAERQYEYIKLAWLLKLDPQLFWTTLSRENADLAGIKAGSDLLQYHFSDLDFDDSSYSQVIWYNEETQAWERVR